MKILVVEDEHRIVQSIKKGLELEKMIVDIAYDGISGFDQATSEEYDLIILDLMLPGMSGWEICSQLRKNKNETPILILTARGQVEEKIEGFNRGADDYLVKPFAFEELVARIRALTRRPKKIVEELLKVEDLTLNKDSFEVKRNHKNIKLSNKEFTLLEFLMRHPGQILSKTQIINHVWNYETDILPNTVEVYIRNLRNKIDKDFSYSLIQTIRGFGYKIGKNV
ncbi:response regulator transcription factor [Candidatus Shapirobacteria bacterium]|mgnify:CR=1 FL=1|nr:response regulator transcription factor [Candidatus Shapirobacteria bacterium]